MYRCGETFAHAFSPSIGWISSNHIPLSYIDWYIYNQPHSTLSYIHTQPHSTMSYIHTLPHSTLSYIHTQPHSTLSCIHTQQHCTQSYIHTQPHSTQSYSHTQPHSLLSYIHTAHWATSTPNHTAHWATSRPHHPQSKTEKQPPMCTHLSMQIFSTCGTSTCSMRMMVCSGSFCFHDWTWWRRTGSFCHLMTVMSNTLSVDLCVSEWTLHNATVFTQQICCWAMTL